MGKEMSELDLAQWTGTENYYRHVGGLLYTDGMKYVAETAGAYWLLDLIASYQPQLRKHKDRRLHDMQFWKLTVMDSKGVIVRLADSGESPAITQYIDYSDFPLTEFQVWVVRGENAMVAMLKSEY